MQRWCPRIAVLERIQTWESIFQTAVRGLLAKVIHCPKRRCCYILIVVTSQEGRVDIPRRLDSTMSEGFKIHQDTSSWMFMNGLTPQLWSFLQDQLSGDPSCWSNCRSGRKLTTGLHWTRSGTLMFGRVQPTNSLEILTWVQRDYCMPLWICQCAGYISKQLRTSVNRHWNQEK